MKRSTEKDQADELPPSAAWTELLALRASTRDLRNTIKTSERTIAESRALLEKVGDGSDIALSFASTASRQD